MEKEAIDHIISQINRGSLLVIGEELTAKGRIFSGLDEEDANPASQLSAPPNLALLERLAIGPWCAVISLARNDCFDNLMRKYYNKLPGSWNIEEIVKLRNVPLANRKVPFIKLLGTTRGTNKYVENYRDYLSRRRKFQNVFRCISDRLKGNPIVFVGIREQSTIAVDVLNEILEILPGNGRAQPIILFEEELNKHNTVICHIAEDCNISQLPLSVSEFSIKFHTNNQIPKSVETSAKEPFEFKNSLVSNLPTSKQLEDISHNRQELYRDALCQPSIIDWTPFKANIDWQRQISNDISDFIKDCRKQLLQKSWVININGLSGVGKTTALKRSAYDLAQEGIPVFWVNSGWHTDFHDLRKFIVFLKRKKKTIVHPVIYCDALARGDLGISDYIRYLNELESEYTVVVGSRISDEIIADEKLNYRFDKEFTVPDVLEDSECKELKSFFKDQGYEVNNVEFNRLLNPKSARDAMCLFWVLKPDTQRFIRESIYSEYKNLSKASDVVRKVSKEVYSGNRNIQRVYDIVAVSTYYGLPLTGSIIVPAVGYSWAEWQAMVFDNSHPIWSLIYEEDFRDPVTGTKESVFRTRNIIVTEAVVEILNGGKIGHSGEFRILKKIVSQCDGTSSYYAHLLHTIFVRREKSLERLHENEHEDLWETAKSTYPLWDRLLQHHYGRFVKNRLKDTDRAYSEIKKALDVENNLTLAHGESEANIYNSLAATLVASCKERRIKANEAYMRVESYIEKARERDRFSPHSAHIQGSSLLQLSDEIKDESVELSLHCINRAFLIVNDARIWSPEQDSHLLQDLERRLYERCSIDDTIDLESQSLEYFNQSGSQSGFVFIGRAFLQQAIVSEKGSDFKKAENKVRHFISIVEKKVSTIDVNLIRLLAEVLIHWRYFLRRPPVPWPEIVERLSIVAEDRSHPIDPTVLFFLGVACYHLGEYSQAEVYFNVLRRLDCFLSHQKQTIRCLLVDDNVADTTLTGRILRRHSKTYIESMNRPILATDRGRFKQANDAPVGFKVGFSLNGVTALKEEFEMPVSTSPFRNVKTIKKN